MPIVQVEGLAPAHSESDARFSIALRVYGLFAFVLWWIFGLSAKCPLGMRLQSSRPE
jgi:hypothetical protein